MTFPSVGMSNPDKILSNVDFPDPEGPVTITREPLGICKSTSLTAITTSFFPLTYSLVSPFASINTLVLIFFPHFCLKISIGLTDKIRNDIRKNPGTDERTTAPKDNRAV